MEGDVNTFNNVINTVISIHSLRMEGDAMVSAFFIFVRSISIHSLRMEGDRTHAREAFHTDISIHSLRMEGDSLALLIVQLVKISIHSLRMEGDFPCVVKVACWKIFQSTPSAWRET